VEKKIYRGVSRGRRLTKSEAAKYRGIRERVMQEIPPLKAAPVKVAIAKLRAMREARGVSLSELAARTGMTRGHLARLESQKNATLRTLERYAEGLDCELEINVVSADVHVKAKREPVGTGDR
jgi:DNA-binding Xre family transcriptional regulator